VIGQDNNKIRKAESDMTVVITVVGQQHTQIQIDNNSTVGEALRRLNVSPEGRKIQLNGADASTASTLHEGDIVVLANKVQGGFR
jgi:sulfur carrier protein ThiS